jgi:DNA polymerase I-like protein with 3'-5' exonuclease and polymerase domains
MRFAFSRQCSEEEALALIHQHRDKVAIDIETVSLENTLPLGIGIAISPTEGFYFFDTRDEYAHLMVESVEKVVFQNAAFDIPILRKLGYTVKSYEDIMLIAYSAGILDKSLASLSQSVLLRECPSVRTLWKKPKQGNIAIDHVKLAGICITHACNTYALEEVLVKTPLYYNIDKPSIELVMEMEGWGVQIDQYALTRVEQSVMDVVTALEVELKAELGVENIGSNPQVAKALKDRGIIGTRKTKSDKDSVSEGSLKPLNLPLTNKILKWRSWMKTLTTYVPAFRKVDPLGRIHTVFGYTDTGRWKSGDKDQGKPNLQNITRDKKFKEE